MAKNIDESVDKLEAAVDPNTVISVGGFNFTPAPAAPRISTTCKPMPVLEDDEEL